MNKLLKIFFTTIKALLCLFITLAVVAWSAYILIITLAHPPSFDWQIVIFTIFSILTIVGIWLISFKKTTTITKIVYSIIFVSFILSPRILPSVMQQLEFDMCLDSGGCWDSIRGRCEKHDQGMCVDGPEKCKELYNGIWDKEKQYCKIK